MDRKERLREAFNYVKSKGLVHTQKDLAVHMGTTEANMSKALRGDKLVLTDNFLRRFNNSFNNVFSFQWLCLGEGQMLNEETHAEIANQHIASTLNIDIAERARTKTAVPYYGDLQVSAGEKSLATVVSSQKPSGYIDIPGMPKSIGAFPVIGCSMEPNIKSGDIVMIAEVDSWEKVDPDKIYMIITNEERMIKHLCVDEDDGSILWCISPNYQRFKIYKADIVAIYRVTFYGRFA